MVSGKMLIGAEARPGSNRALTAFNPSTGADIEPAFGTASLGDVADACALAGDAAWALRISTPGDRAALLEAIAERLVEGGGAIVDRAMTETGLPRMRLEGELGRTTNQLRLFAATLRDGAYLDVRLDGALPDRTPPRPDLRMMHVPVGPVAVFAASNFPLAFSVAGGDTASALAAGCPVIVKAHGAHPGTSELVGRAVQAAVADRGFPQGTFSLLFGAGIEIGTALVEDARIQAVGFTGSRSGGLALLAAARRRRQPIPVFAEMSSINPVILLPGALAERGEAIGKAFAAALNLGAGQFCTNPGLLLAIDGPGLDDFVVGAAGAMAEIAAATMLSAGIHRAYRDGRERLATRADVDLLAEGPAADGLVARSALFGTTAGQFQADPALGEEVFGATSILVRCTDLAQMLALLRDLEGQLTIAIHTAAADERLAAELMPVAERLAGRILFNGFGTGVEVCDAMVHGGPFPATSDVRTTSVGSLAIARFVRPICYQDAPASLQPEAVRDANPFGVPRRVNGVRE